MGPKAKAEEAKAKEAKAKEEVKAKEIEKKACLRLRKLMFLKQVFSLVTLVLPGSCGTSSNGV